jgi:hypothetical protein
MKAPIGIWRHAWPARAASAVPFLVSALMRNFNEDAADGVHELVGRVAQFIKRFIGGVRGRRFQRIGKYTDLFHDPPTQRSRHSSGSR